MIGLRAWVLAAAMAAAGFVPAQARLVTASIRVSVTVLAPAGAAAGVSAATLVVRVRPGMADPANPAPASATVSRMVVTSY